MRYTRIPPARSVDLTDRDRTDLAELRGTIANAVEQLRETVAVPHDPPGTETGAGLAVDDTVEDPLARAVASGVPVRWERHGAMPTLSPLIERGMYRVVQESLTNAVKHASDGVIRVRITHEADRTRVSVVNAAPPAEEPAQAAETPATRAARRRSAAAFVAPVAAAAFFVPAAVHLAWQLTTSVLPPSRFDELTTGRPRTELARCCRPVPSPTRPTTPVPYPGRPAPPASSTVPAATCRARSTSTGSAGPVTRWWRRTPWRKAGPDRAGPRRPSPRWAATVW